MHHCCQRAGQNRYEWDILPLTLIDFAEDVDEVDGEFGIVPFDLDTVRVGGEGVERECAHGIRDEVLVDHQHGIHECSQILCDDESERYCRMCSEG